MIDPHIHRIFHGGIVDSWEMRRATARTIGKLPALK